MGVSDFVVADVSVRELQTLFILKNIHQIKESHEHFVYVWETKALARVQAEVDQQCC